MDQAGYVWPHMVRMRARGGEENEAYGPLEFEGEIDSVNQSFLYLVNAGFMKGSLHLVSTLWTLSLPRR